MAEELKLELLQEMVNILPPEPIRRSYGISLSDYEKIFSKPNWHGSIRDSLFLLVGESKELSPDITKELRTIDLFALNAYFNLFKNISTEEDKFSLAAKFGSLLDNIQKANAVAARAFAYVKAELANKEVKIQFGIDFDCMTHDNTMPTPAYFAIHLGDSYKITADTPHKEFIQKYCEWLQKNFTSS